MSLKGPGRVQDRLSLGQFGHVSVLCPVVVARKMQCADWPDLGHVPIRWETTGTESRLEVIPPRIVDTEQTKTTGAFHTRQTLLGDGA